MNSIYTLKSVCQILFQTLRGYKNSSQEAQELDLTSISHVFLNKK